MILHNSDTASSSWATLINKEMKAQGEAEHGQEKLASKRFSPNLRAHVYNQDTLIPLIITNAQEQNSQKTEKGSEYP